MFLDKVIIQLVKLLRKIIWLGQPVGDFVRVDTVDAIVAYNNFELHIVKCFHSFVLWDVIFFLNDVSAFFALTR